MAKVRISCNPKNKRIEYARLNSKTGEWESIDNKKHANSKLLSEELSQDFSAINANKILDAIIDEFNDSHIDLVFAGSEDEFIILNSICKNKKYSSIVSLSRDSQESKAVSGDENTKIRNKRLHISSTECIMAILVLIALVFGAYFLSQYVETRNNYNIKDTNVDFIISAPNKEQVREISELSHIKSIVPYKFRTIEVNSGKKTIETNLYIIENKDDLSSTVFSEKLLIKKSIQESANPIFISDNFSTISKKKLNDELELVIDGKAVKFVVSGIYKSDNRNVGGTLIAVSNNEIVSAMTQNDRYNGAYICSNDIVKTRAYLEDYQPLGDLRTRDEFSSDEAYNIYLSEKETDKGQLLLDREKYLINVGKRNDTNLFRSLLLSIACALLALIILCISVGMRLIGYIKKHADNDMRNSFTLKQERKMFRRFCILDLLILVFAYIISLLVSLIVFKIQVFTVFSLIGIVILALVFIGEYYIAVTKLDAVFTKRVKKQKK